MRARREKERYPLKGGKLIKSSSFALNMVPLLTLSKFPEVKISRYKGFNNYTFVLVILFNFIT